MKFRVGVATTYCDEVEVEAETEEEALRIAREMNARAEVPIRFESSDVEYVSLGPVVIGTNWYEGYEPGKAVHDHFRRG